MKLGIDNVLTIIGEGGPPPLQIRTMAGGIELACVDLAPGNWCVISEYKFDALMLRVRLAADRDAEALEEAVTT